MAEESAVNYWVRRYQQCLTSCVPRYKPLVNTSSKESLKAMTLQANRVPSVIACLLLYRDKWWIPILMSSTPLAPILAYDSGTAATFAHLSAKRIRDHRVPHVTDSSRSVTHCRG
ncbi:hypothetical protein L210DRAFT_3560700 [Boletus edulis BED1]|uniref:Uncharacterized protein n=1 Tax=Boletus edulis BED1 TaxID=1328754 RepID=A0AAD4BIA8_BOLED|nr:hypothetical protein L210DRAFT_3586222 [Boletus edulis BED1]KAF8431300.1 hypothetical protein L210DRAFT_3560700 [Boletus edulis BED1]